MGFYTAKSINIAQIDGVEMNRVLTHRIKRLAGNRTCCYDAVDGIRTRDLQISQSLTYESGALTS